MESVSLQQMTNCGYGRRTSLDRHRQTLSGAFAGRFVGQKGRATHRGQDSCSALTWQESWPSLVSALADVIRNQPCRSVGLPDCYSRKGRKKARKSSTSSGSSSAAKCPPRGICVQRSIRKWRSASSQGGSIFFVNHCKM